MQTIRMMTEVLAPVERVFRLSLSLDLEAEVLKAWGMRPLPPAHPDQVAAGLIANGQRVTWSGRQFGWGRQHTSLIDAYRAPLYFRDVMERGSFVRFEHEHHFATMNDGTRMRDQIRFEMPWGMFGGLMTGRVQRRLERMLESRNAAIKAAAEGEGWRRYLRESLLDPSGTAPRPHEPATRSSVRAKSGAA